MDITELWRLTWETLVVFLTLMILSRVLGKTQVGQMTFYEYISGITIGSVAANILASEPEMVWTSYYVLVIFFIMTYAAAKLTIVSRPLRKLIEGSPTMVIEKGQILEDNMRGMRYDIDELNGQLREKGILDLAEVEYAFIETSGALSVIKKPAYQPVTKQDLNISPAQVKLPVILVMDGEIIRENLGKAGVTEEWLRKELQKRGVADLAKAVLVVIDSKSKLYISTDNK
ncbi:MAG TPA: DUF421 domain-containing protein [Negativicutes bacterium]|nr:DUF421 domain-containing protein [Negativicutes bacterium]